MSTETKEDFLIAESETERREYLKGLSFNELIDLFQTGKQQADLEEMIINYLVENNLGE